MALLLLPGRASRLDAHPLHTTMAEITLDRPRNAVHLVVRVFEDDLAKASGESRPATTGALTTRMSAYVLRAFVLMDADRPLPLRACGIRHTGDLLWICLEAPAPGDSSHLRLTNALLCDLFDDQINIVRTTLAGAPRTLLFVKGDRAKSLS